MYVSQHTTPVPHHQHNTTTRRQYGTATNIKSRTNRLSVLDAITSTQQRLKLYSKVPPNGLVRVCVCICMGIEKPCKYRRGWWVDRCGVDMRSLT
jgi:peptide subunit release factor 1 (eRF1)